MKHSGTDVFASGALAPPVAVDTPGTKTAARPRLQIFWYHPDHLGTGMLITDLEGRPHQFFLNLPYGETFIEQKHAGYDNPYKFNGKELDQETGLYYYGARYYDPKISLWLSVDPLAEKYPNMSPYVYTAGNPVVLVDPDGKAYSPPKWLKNFIKKWNNLNNKEKNIIRWDIQFYKALSIERNAEEAYEMTSKVFGKNGKGDISDAFRHAYWQARNVQEVGKSFTQKWADAHEYSTPKDEVFTDLVMDIHNNDVGIEIGLENPNATPEELANIILQRIEKGDMLIIDKNNQLLKSDGTKVEKNEIRRYNVSSTIANEIINNPESQKIKEYEYN